MAGVEYVAVVFQGCSKNLDIHGIYETLDAVTANLHISQVATPIAAEDEDKPVFSGFSLLTSGYIYLLIDVRKREALVQLYQPPREMPQRLLEQLCRYFDCDDAVTRTISSMEEQ